MGNDVQQIESKAGALVAMARGLVVTDAESYQVAGEFLLRCKDYRKQVAAAFDPTVKATRAAWQTALAERKRHDDPADQAEGIAKETMLGWERAEHERLQAEANARAAEKRREAEEKQLAAAQRAEDAGQHDKAEHIVSQPTPVAPVKVERAAPKMAGVQVRITWHFEVMDDALVPDEFKEIDRKALAAFARRHKDQAKIPGVRFYSDRSMAAGR